MQSILALNFFSMLMSLWHIHIHVCDKWSYMWKKVKKILQSDNFTVVLGKYLNSQLV